MCSSLTLATATTCSTAGIPVWGLPSASRCSFSVVLVCMCKSLD
jgi:hypothetical protein